MQFQLNARTDYGYVGILIVFLLFLKDLLIYFGQLVFGSIGIRAQSKLALSLSYGPVSLIFFVLLILTIYFILFKQKFAAYTAALILINKIIISTFNSYNGWFHHINTHYLNVIVTAIFIFFGIYLFLKPKQKHVTRLDVMAVIGAGIYFILPIIF